MKSFAFVVLCSVAAARDVGHPIEKVIDLLQGLATKSEMEGKHEALTYEKFEYWCKNSLKSLGSAIAEERATIDKLEEKIAAATENKASLEEQISELTKQIAEQEASGEKAKKDRKMRKDVYTGANQDYADTIKAVKEALKGLEGARDETEAMSFVQQAMPFVVAAATDSQRAVLESFVQEEPTTTQFTPPEQLAKGNRAAHVDKYASKSHSVIELLKGLVQKFEEEQLDSTKAETNSLNSYDESKEARDNAITAAQTSKGKKETELADTEQELEEAKTDLASTQSDLDEDTASQSDTKQACERKAQEWAERSKTRAGELEAMATAVKILSKSTGVRTDAPSNPVPPPAPFEAEAAEATAFLQIPHRRGAMKAIQLLRVTASRTNSKALERLAQELSAHLTGPFDEVNNMIEKMIFHLLNEQKQEDVHKNWCDLEIEKTNTSIVDKAAKVDELKTKINAEQAKVQELAEEIKAAAEMVADIVQHMKMAEEVRAVGKKENELAIKDAEQAQSSIADATAVLESFYKDSGMVKKESWEFVQAPVALGAKPETWDSSYTGVSDPTNQPNGIITVLEGCASEFATMEADTRAQEASDQKDFEQDMKDSKIEKTRRESEAREKTQEMKNKEENIASMQKVKKHTEGELEKTEQYMTDLQPACVEGDSTYEDRKAARTQEVVALQEAQGILADAFKEKDTDDAAAPAAAPVSLIKKHLRA